MANNWHSTLIIGASLSESHINGYFNGRRVYMYVLLWYVCHPAARHFIYSVSTKAVRNVLD